MTKILDLGDDEVIVVAPAAKPAAEPAAEPALTKPAERFSDAMIAENKAPLVRAAVSLADWAGIKREKEGEQKDNLFVPKGLIPDGFVVEWKRKSVHNKDDKTHAMALRRAGWRPVPASMEGFSAHFQSFIDPGSDIIEYEGVILMIRPKSMSDEAKKEQQHIAESKVTEKMAELDMPGNKDMPRRVFNRERGYEERLPGGNPNAITAPE